MASKKVAVVTGGASGMGLAVATELSRRPDWTIHILDLNKSGSSVAASINASFHECNVTNEANLASIFKSIFTQHHRLDFVFANAGIAEMGDFYNDAADKDTDEPVLPVSGMHPLVDINLKGVITTTYLANFYMRKTPNSDKNIVMTASCGGIYPAYYSPIYTATKHAVVGMMRSIAPWYYHKAGIRVNAICPGIVRTGLLTNEQWANFPQEYFTPVEKIAQTVLMLIDGKDDGTGKKPDQGAQGTTGWGDVLTGKAVEISGQNHYYREAVPFSDEAMRTVMGSTNVEAWDGSKQA